ncbi:MAG: SDR family oxidoreductase [Phycisphaerae bacterium]|nr:SDR family oxidoreductase [Phycisphaerae bacterium]
MARKRWLVTGAGGQLGGHVLRQLVRDHAADEVMAWTHTRGIAMDGIHAMTVDLACGEEVRRGVAEYRPTNVIHLGAVTAVGVAHAEPHHARQVNVEGTRWLAEGVGECGGRLIYCSTDMVFDGEHAPYGERDTPRPVSVYGQTKHEAEQVVAGFERTLVVRPPLMYGLPCTDRPTTFVSQLAALRRGEPLRLFTDEFRTPCSLADVARALIGLALEEELTGTMHVAGPERFSRYDLIARCAALLEIGWPNLVPISRLSIDAPEPRPPDLALSCTVLEDQYPELVPGPICREALTGEQE